MKLSKRLEAVIEMVSRQTLMADGKFCAADVGTDHGFVPICLTERGIVERALALDVREGPLMRAREHVREHGLESKIQLRLGDGLTPLRPGEADVVILTGMGGELMLRIMRDGEHVRDSVKAWVLSPQSEPEVFRHGLDDLGLVTEDEAMVEEDGKYYVIMTAKKGIPRKRQEYEYRYGEILIREKSLVLGEFLEREILYLSQIRERLMENKGDGAKRRLPEVERRLREAKKTRELIQE